MTPRLALAALALTATGLAACSSTTKQSITTATTVVESTLPPAETTAPTTPPASAPPTAAPEPETTLPNQNLWDQVEAPKLPIGHTDPFLSSGVLSDGVYWVNYNGGEEHTPDITVVEMYFGAECEAEAAKRGEECLNDMYSPPSPTRDIDDLPFHDNVFLTVADSTTQLSYWVTPGELVQMRGSSPSDGAPVDYSFTPFSFLMTVKKGEITHFEQVWTP